MDPLLLAGSAVSDDGNYQGYEDQRSGQGNFNRGQYYIESMLNRISTATLVKIVKAPYDKDGNPITPGSNVDIGFVDVLPLVNQVDGRGKATKHDTVHSLAYFRYAGGKNAILLDPAKDDIGLANFADRDISSVKANKGQANPGSGRRFDMADGIFQSICLGGAGAEQFMAFTSQGITLQDKSGNKIEMSPTGIAVTTAKFTCNNDIVAGFGGGDQVSLQHHLHLNAGGTGDSGAPKPGT